MQDAAQGLVRLLAVLAGIVAGLGLLEGVIEGVMVTGSIAEGVVGVVGVSLVLLVGTRVLLPRVALRRRLRSVAVVLGATGCGVGLASMFGTPATAWLGDGAALAVCSSGALIAMLVACAVLDDGDPAVP